jgi:hypothetical protein
MIANSPTREMSATGGLPCRPSSAHRLPFESRSGSLMWRCIEDAQNINSGFLTMKFNPALWFAQTGMSPCVLQTNRTWQLGRRDTAVSTARRA